MITAARTPLWPKSFACIHKQMYFFHKVSYCLSVKVSKFVVWLPHPNKNSTYLSDLDYPDDNACIQLSLQFQ